MATSMPLMWKWKRWVWTRWYLLRYRLSRPQHIGRPGSASKPLNATTIRQIYPEIPLDEVVAVERLPKEEAKLGMRVLVGIGLLLERLLSQAQPGLPEIDADGERALDDANIARYTKAFRAPRRPAVYAADGPTDLGELAVRSPYAVFLERDEAGELHWDFRGLSEFEHQDGVCSLGVRVVFREEPASARLVASRIESLELGAVREGDGDWERATALAVCAATTRLSLARHFTAVHLVSGDHWDLAARNQLPTDHPVFRLLWPHIFNSFYTNYGITRVSMLPAGDFVNMFGLSYAGLAALLDEAYRTYDIAVTDPVADWARRGLGDERFDHPTHDNLVDLFEVMHAHATRYLDAYFDDDEELRADHAVRRWLEELASLVPNGLGGVEQSPTKAGLARLIAGYMSEGNTIHDMVGTTLWDYQLWSDRNPTRVYQDGRRAPLDVLQRVVNHNFALQIRRAPLLADYGEVALDARGAALFTQFHDECRALQARYDELPDEPWRMEPKNLEINMNG